MPKKKKTATGLSPQELMAQINGELGYDAVALANDDQFEIERIPFGILSIDELMGGGAPKGRYIEGYGGFSLGKTTMFLKLVANAQAMGHHCFWLDPEKSFDRKWARHHGVDVDELILVQKPVFGDEYFDIAKVFLRSGNFGVGICDSIASLYPMQEDGKATSTLMPGTQARLMSKGLRSLTALNRNTVLGFINQTREKIGIMFGDPTTTSGGKAMSFYAGVRIQLSASESIKTTMRIWDAKSADYKQKDVVTAQRVNVKITKDKTGGALQEATGSFVFHRESGTFDPVEDIFNLGRKYGLIEKSSNTYTYGKVSATGKDNFKKLLGKKRLYLSELEEEIRSRITSASERMLESG